MGITQEFIANIVKTDIASIDDATVKRTKLRVLDAIGCLVAGAKAPGCRMVAELVKDWGGANESTILVYGIQGTAHNVAMVNSLLTRSYDFEPVMAEGEIGSIAAHISGTTVPAALAMAEKVSASGKDLIEALVLGDDLASRIHVAAGFNVDFGWDNTGTVNVLGATVIACKLLHLNEKQILDALGIALNQMGGTIAGVIDHSIAFKLPNAFSSRNGIISAEMAKSGFCGIKDPLIGPHGFFSLYSRNNDLRGLTSKLGEKFYADRVIKAYPCCYLIHPAIDSALKIVGVHNIDIDEVEEITIQVTPPIMNMVGRPFVAGVTPQVDAAFSLVYSVATALLRKEVKPKYFTNQFINDPQISNLINKIKLIGCIPPEKGLRTEVYLKMKGGKVINASTDIPKGDIFDNPLTEAEIYAKYRENVLFSNTISHENAERALELIDRLDELDEIRQLTSLLVENR